MRWLTISKSPASASDKTKGDADEKVLMALSVAGATVFGANAQEFGLGQPQAPSPNEIVMPAPVQPMPSPSIDGWVRPIPVPDNPGISGGIRAGDISGSRDHPRAQRRRQNHYAEPVYQLIEKTIGLAWPFKGQAHQRENRGSEK
jgi:hypothetical protein